jgi:tetratricopeptide (TPR) repeat protein
VDEVTSALARMPSLQTAARASAYAFRGQVIDAKKAAAQLGVRNVLELSVQRRGETLHVNADLVNGETGLTRWSRTSDYALNNLATIHESVANDVADALHVRDATHAGPHHEPPREAVELYLRGRYAADIGGKEDLLRAIQFFQHAHQIDTAYAQAYAAEATAWGEISDAFLPPYECYPKADTLSRHALALDSTIAEAWSNLGWVDALFARDLPAAEAKFQRAVRLVPNDALSHNFYAQFLMFNGRFAEAQVEDRKAIQLDPPNAWYLEVSVATYALLTSPILRLRRGERWTP